MDLGASRHTQHTASSDGCALDASASAARCRARSSIALLTLERNPSRPTRITSNYSVVYSVRESERKWQERIFFKSHTYKRRWLLLYM